MIFRRSLIITLFALTTVLVACDTQRKPLPPTVAKKLQSTSLRLKWLPQSQFAGIFWAKERGIFDEAGLNVTVLPGGPNINVLQLVASGAEEFGICGASQIVTARSNDVPVVAIAILFRGTPGVFMAKQSSGIRTVSDWVGKSVGSSPGTDGDLIVKAMIKNANIDPQQVRLVPSNFDMTPFFEDRVDVWPGYRINEPHVARDKGFEIVEIYPEDYGINVCGDTLFTSENMIKNHPERVQKMVSSVLEGWEQAIKDQGEAVRLVCSINSKLNTAREEQMLQSVVQLIYPKGQDDRIGWMTKDRWQGMIELWYEYGGIDEKLESTGCFDNRFVERYNSNRSKELK